MADRFICGDALEVLRTLPSESVHCVVTSPPYWCLRDYHVEGQIGLEQSPEDYVSRLVAVFGEVRRVLRPDGTLWLNLGDCYNGSGGAGGDYNKGGLEEGQPKYPGRKIARLKPKDLVGIPWRVAFALQADGWYLRSDIIWHKPNPMPESVTDRPTKAYEHVFLLSKSPRYFYDAAAIAEPAAYADSRRESKRRGEFSGKTEVVEGREAFRAIRATRNKRDVWTVATQPFPGAHFAVFPEALVEPCILAGTSEAGCCPKCGAPWVRVVEKETVNRAGWGASNPHHATPFGTHGPSLRGEGRCGDVRVTTLGWQPTCTCNAGPPIPCTVLDPFGGSGTVSMVAKRFGRHSIYIDLNREYVDMAVRRTLGE